MNQQLPYAVAGSRVGLRPTSEADLRSLHEWLGDFLVFNLLSWAQSVGTFEEFAQRMALHLRQSINFVVVQKSSGQPIGFVFAYDANLIAGWCFVLVFTVKDHRRQALGREAAFLFWEYLFNSFRFRKIYMDVSEFNSGWLESAPAMEAGLMQEEGHFRDHLLVDGQRWAVKRLALYREKWEQMGEFLLRLVGVEAASASVAEQQGSVSTDKEGGSPSTGALHFTETPSSRAEILQMFLSYPQHRSVDAALALLAKDVVFESPVTGVVEGRSRLEKLMRDRQALLDRLGGAPEARTSIMWSEPVEEDHMIKVLGSSGGAGSLEVTLTFDSEGRVTRYSWHGPMELMVAYYLGTAPSS